MTITARQILASAPVRFRPEKAQNIRSTFHFIITGDENFEVSLIINDGKCVLEEGLKNNPDCLVKTSAKTYVELETGKANPQMALMMGKIKVSNISEMMKFAKCFRRFDPQILQKASSEINNPKSTIRNIRTGPLEGVKIIDLTRLLPGPLATMMLADMGADVIKVEDPDSPDYIRNFEPFLEGTSAFYYALNRNKRSLAINFLSKEGKSIIIDLIKNADVLIEQYRPGVMKKFGLDYESLQAINPKLIYVSITGYGQDSSMSQAAGHDINYIAIAGALGITIDDNGVPVIPGFQLADIAGGSYMTMNAVIAALYKREKTNTGDYIDIAMTDSVLPYIALPYAEYQANNNTLRKGKFQLSGSQANYNIYKCSDGKYLALGSLEPKFWNTVCDRLGKTEWQEKIIGDSETQIAVREDLQNIFMQKTRDEWITFFSEDDICLTPINNLSEIGSDKYLNERKLFIDFELGDKKIKTIAQPIKFSSVTEANNWIAPQLGEDTYTILKGLDMTDEKINELIDLNIVKTT
jgi:crotonobetainyl-CoA:carnitine CoA-transferase CaiB-like acyl-CoA transferase/putative sterol carrier protein